MFKNLTLNMTHIAHIARDKHRNRNADSTLADIMLIKEFFLRKIVTVYKHRHFYNTLELLIAV